VSCLRDLQFRKNNIKNDDRYFTIKKLDKLFFCESVLSTMKVLNYINYGLVWLASTSVMYGSNRNSDWQKNVQGVVSLFFWGYPKGAPHDRYREFLIKTGLSDKDGNFNKNASGG
jgi:hypothetical protein